MEPTTTLEDVEEHMADSNYFYPDICLMDLEDMAMRFAKTFGTETIWRQTEGWIMSRRHSRRTK